MKYRAFRLGKFSLTLAGDVSGVLAITGRSATFYGITWRWLSLGITVLR